ncbi:MAG: transposase [Planctomycetes bacterium]|nr:transposase [Planctomycetota bacterium]
MPSTIGYHIVIAGYGLWLPGDDRGSWSEAWDEQIGYSQPHTVHDGDPVRKRMAQERMRHAPVRLDDAMIQIVVETVRRCESASDWSIAAASVEPTHSHLLLTYTRCDIDNTVKWIKDRTTKAIRRETNHQGPVWCKGKWRSFMFDDQVWSKTAAYIERHNIRHGEPAQPYPIITTP